MSHGPVRTDGLIIPKVRLLRHPPFNIMVARLLPAAPTILMILWLLDQEWSRFFALASWKQTTRHLKNVGLDQISSEVQAGDEIVWCTPLTIRHTKHNIFWHPYTLTVFKKKVHWHGQIWAYLDYMLSHQELLGIWHKSPFWSGNTLRNTHLIHVVLSGPTVLGTCLGHGGAWLEWTISEEITRLEITIKWIWKLWALI